MAPRDHTVAILATAATAASVILTGAAFWLSYAHLHAVAAGHGLDASQDRAWAWPATIDLFVIIGELLILRSSLAGRVDGWAVTLTVFGSAGSIALNVAGVGTTAPLLDQIVAAVPPVAALLAFGALMRQIHEHITQRRDTAEAELPPVYIDDETADDEPETPPERPDGTPPPGGTRKLLTTAETMATLGVSRATLNRWISSGRITPVTKDPVRGNLYDPADLKRDTTP